jgi:glycosyltransferase involved in cell wall biosynthesis
MNNYAGIERILTCKMNYIAEKTSNQVFLCTYEQLSQEMPFPLYNRITHKPINTPIPQRDKMSFIKWVRSYINARFEFQNQLLLLLNEIRPDIVVCTVYSYQVLDIIIKSCHQLGIKTIMESHTKGETITMARKFSYNKVLRHLFSLYDYRIMKSLKFCQCVVTLTKQDIPFWRHYAKHIEVIPNMLTITPKRVTNYKEKRVISAGRYMTEKGFDRLIIAWQLVNRKYNDWQLFIYGNGDRTPYQQLVNQYKLNSTVHLLPATDDIAEEFSKSSIYVMSSRHEGFGLVLAEAMSCGLPCISFDCPYGPRGIITDGEDGLLVEDGNIKDLAQKMEELIADSELRESMGTKAIQNIARYNPETIMNRWLTLFNNI